ncbi:MAG: hypothetical protein LIP02_00605 [Bacteroidales bacterium]|nr:hypothetical protein [Bacteroidales bacterium]
MFKIILIIIYYCLFIINQSGYGMALHTYNYTWEATAILLAIMACGYYRLGRTLQPALMRGFMLLLTAVVMIPWICGQEVSQGLSYLSVFLVTLLFAALTYPPKILRIASFIIGGMGLIILWIYANDNILSGWNDNAIAMIGLFSYLFFAIFLYDKRLPMWVKIAVTVLYFMFLWKTNCRSAHLIMILAVLLYYFQRRVFRTFQQPWFNILVLQVPLLIALLVIYVGGGDIVDNLQDWTEDNYEKSLFNGRDKLWGLGINYFLDSPIIGTSKFLFNYHNSGIAALSVFGALGYIAWIYILLLFLKPMTPYLLDPIVYGCYVSFLLIYVQQSLDLGLISPEPILIPYMILGIGLARVCQIDNYRSRIFAQRNFIYTHKISVDENNNANI